VARTNTSAAAAGLALALMLAACSADTGPFSNIGSKFDFAAPKPNPLVKNEFEKRVITANDLIGANGYCPGEAASAAAPQALNFTAGPQAGPATGSPPPPATAPAAPVRSGVSLGMTECEVVQALGHTDRIEIAANEHGQRSVTLTYLQGERPGVYRFVAGQLVSIERAGEPPAPAKPAKPKKAAKQPPA
jgi:hypothetical protein